MRLIDADKIKIPDTHVDAFENCRNCELLDKYQVQELIDSAPTIEVSTWISCSERPPREEEQDDELGVLVTLGNGYSGLQYDWYHGDHWYDWDGFVVAWMPLPEPWKGEKQVVRSGGGEPIITYYQGYIRYCEPNALPPPFL